MTPKGRHALALAKQGFRVFPLPVDNPDKTVAELKKPLLSGDWKALATTDETQIARWWSQDDCNIAIATLPSDDLVIFDYDMKEGQVGAKGLAIHEMMYDLPESMRVRTASGGFHVYMRAPKGTRIPNSISKLHKNVDVKGNHRGGYVVAPGSTFHGKPYTLVQSGPLEEVPSALVELALSSGHRKSSLRNTDVIGVLDEESSISRATYYLVHSAPVATMGAGSNDQTYRIACKVRDCGISEATCLDLLLEHWNETKSNPPWPGSKLATVVEHAYEYAELPIGIDNGASVEFGIVPLATPARAGLDRVRFRAGWNSALTRVGEPLIDEVLDVGRLSVMYGQSGSGKTFNALDLAFHVAAGKPWHGGRKVKQGLVVYVAAEGGAGIFKRTAALGLKHDIKDDIPLDIVPCPIDLMRTGKDSDTHKLIALVREAEADHGQRCEMIVIDTLSRALAGGDENASTDMGVFIKHVDGLRMATGAHVMIVHHSGKDQARGARGWSGVKAAVDTEMSVHEGKLSFQKQRDMDMAEPVAFKLEVVRIGEREDGKAVTSCVVRYLDVTDIPAVDGLNNAPLEVLKVVIGLAERKIGLVGREDEERGALCREMQAVAIETKDIVAAVGKSKQNVGNQLTQHLAVHFLKSVPDGRWSLLPTALERWKVYD